MSGDAVRYNLPPVDPDAVPDFTFEVYKLKCGAELVGKTGEEAKKIIIAENPKLFVEIMHHMSCVTEDFCNCRVRVFVDDDGKVVRVPHVC